MPEPRSSNPTTASVGLPASGTYRLDPARSRANFTTRHLFGLGTVTGSLAVLDGHVTVRADPSVWTVIATLDAGSFDSASAARDELVKSPGYLDVGDHPCITFSSRGLVQDGGARRIRGALTVRGVAAPVELTITEIHDIDGLVTVQATATLDRYAHGLTKAKGLAARLVQVQLTATAARI